MLLRNAFISLQQLRLSKIAIEVFHDPDVQNFLATHGTKFFIWPNDTSRILGGTSNKLFHRAKKIERSYIGTNFCYEQPCEIRLTGDRKITSLPKRQWEILVRLKLPPVIKSEAMTKRVMDLIHFMVMQTDDWLRDHGLIFCIPADFQKRLQWTKDAKLDKQKTAKALIDDSDIFIKDRFQLACHYCYEEDVFSLWDGMDALHREYYQDSVPEIVGTWIQCIREKTDIDWRKIAAYSLCNPLGLKNFFPKLTQKERLEWLLLALERRWIEDDEFQFCLSKLDQNLHIELSKKVPFEILETFLFRPVHGELLDVVEFLQPYLSAKQFCDFLGLIFCHKILFGSTYFNYVLLITELWEKSPPQYKELVNMEEFYYILNDLVQPYASQYPLRMYIMNKRYLSFNVNRSLLILFKDEKRMNDFCKTHTFDLIKFRRVDMICFSEN
ncbi:uncharacterized protein NPIL_615691 [Nephila pilipes]|uniref:Uncharacterized protein n=1 Tax=Nephila pilipes TaxID=299642 RepID=A0A8X6N338_NEPPI|nr:uncharacterized protein NPIL_615691 [Nephila pilipes]